VRVKLWCFKRLYKIPSLIKMPPFLKIRIPNNDNNGNTSDNFRTSNELKKKKQNK
jgi:hypothetical protein